jgi:hypothetical protein
MWKGGEVGMIQIDIKMPKCCDECFALDDYGDYPFCLISQDQRGYTFNTKEKRMPTCPLKAQEPRVMTLEEVKALQPDTDIWIEVRYLNAPIRIRACTVSGFSPGGTRLFIIGGAHNYPMDMYNNYFRVWTSRPTDEQKEAVKWE